MGYILMHSLVDIEGAAHHLVIDSPLVYCGRRAIVGIEITAEGGDIRDATFLLVYYVARRIEPFDIINLAASSRETIITANIGDFADFKPCKESLDSNKQLVNLQLCLETSIAVGFGY